MEKVNTFETMILNIKNRFRKIAPYKDRPNTFSENINQTIGTIVVILLVGAFLYLVITGLPTIKIVLNMYLQEIIKFFNN